MGDVELNLDVSFEGESPEEVIKALNAVQAKGVKQVPTKGMTGVEVVIVGIMVANAVSNLVIKLLPLWKSGVVVDTRGKRVLTKKDSKLPRGSVLIISKDGTKTQFDKPQETDLKPFMEQLTGEKS